MANPGLTIVSIALTLGLIFLGIEAFNTDNRTTYPPRDKAPRAYKTIKTKRYICSRCHEDGNAEFMKRLEP
ncbi:MAG: hypothetical protein C4586_08565 [Anaerolineaceae bacterium]|nr:MAG: hypothetical protein C4586_08565 [Anaerolineaceae bacterium]